MIIWRYDNLTIWPHDNGGGVSPLAEERNRRLFCLEWRNLTKNWTVLRNFIYCRWRKMNQYLVGIAEFHKKIDDISEFFYLTVTEKQFDWKIGSKFFALASLAYFWTNFFVVRGAELSFSSILPPHCWSIQRGVFRSPTRSGPTAKKSDYAIDGCFSFPK